MELQTELFHVEITFLSDFYHLLFFYFFLQPLLKAVLVQVELFTLLLAESKPTLDHLLTSRFFLFTFQVLLLFLVLLILSLPFLIDVLRVFSDISSLFLFDLSSLLHFFYFSLSRFLQVQLLDFLLIVTLTLLFTIQLQVETLFFTNTFFDFLGIQKFTFLFFQLLVLLAKFFLLMQESLCLVI